MRFSLLNKLVIFCLGLIAVRIITTGNWAFSFLAWNLFLAWLPLWLIRKRRVGDAKLKQYALLFMAVLFLPNAPYIVTDLFHLKKNLSAPLWFDLLLLLSCALTGLIYFIMSFEKILEGIRILFPRYGWMMKPALFLASAYGIYLGRYFRFNSWDIFVRPFNLAGEVYASVFRLNLLLDSVLFTITFAIFLYLVFEIYISFRNKATLHPDELH